MDAIISLLEQWVWPVTLAASLFSLIVFNILVLCRFIRDKRVEKETARKRQMERHLLIHLSNPLKNPAALLLPQPKEYPLLAAVAPNVLRSLKGASYTTALDVLEATGLYDWLARELTHPNPRRCLPALALAAYIPDAYLTRLIKEGLAHPHPTVRHAVIDALAQRQDKTLLPVVLEQAILETQFSVPLLCDVFRKMGSSIAAELADMALMETTALNIRLGALMALSKGGQQEYALKAATPLLQHQIVELRVLAWAAYAHAVQSPSLAVLRVACGDNDWRVRQSAARCAGFFRPLPTEVLLFLLNDSNWLVGLAAAQALFNAEDSGQQLLKMTARKHDSIAGNRARMMLAERQGTYAMG